MTLEINDVSKQYKTRDGTIDALQTVNLEIASGEVICVVGSSGCGKTTLLNIIAGFLDQTSGSVILDGEPVSAPGPDRGVIFQSTSALLPWLTVEQNVAFGPKLRGKSRQDTAEIVDRYLKLTGLWEFRNRGIYELSGGMQQRVALCRVLVNDSKVLLMDEPFGALDALTREKMQEELLEVCRRSPRIVFLITHSAEEAVFLGDRVIVMSPRPGRIVREFRSPYGGAGGERKTRETKSDPGFVALREEVVTAILNEG